MVTKRAFENAKAVAYLRTSSRSNVGAGKDSDKRQREAIKAYAASAGFDLVGEFYDAAVSGADPVGERAGFAAMLEALLANGARTIIVELPDRFARDRRPARRPRPAEGAGHHAHRGVCALALHRGHADRDPDAPDARRHRRVREDDPRRQAGCAKAQATIDRPEGRRAQNPRRGAPGSGGDGAEAGASAVAQAVLAHDLGSAGRGRLSERAQRSVQSGERGETGLAGKEPMTMGEAKRRKMRPGPMTLTRRCGRTMASRSTCGCSTIRRRARSSCRALR